MPLRYLAGQPRSGAPADLELPYHPMIEVLLAVAPIREETDERVPARRPVHRHVGHASGSEGAHAAERQARGAPMPRSMKAITSCAVFAGASCTSSNSCHWLPSFRTSIKCRPGERG